MIGIPQHILAQAIDWRRAFHTRPEIGLHEHDTAERVATLLESFGLEVQRGIAKTGVVGTLRNGDGPSIGLRADMDALPIQEKNTFDHQSATANCMHACGHDGHMAILLATARYLSETRRFSGTVHFVFQPAEENAGGGQMMVEEGLFQRFPMQAIYALHNWPGLTAGNVTVNPGPMMASHDSFCITLTGKSCHAAMPDRGIDPIIAAAELILALQTITSRRISPQETAVVSVTQIHSGDAMNIIPDTAVLSGTVRCLQADTREKVLALFADLVTTLPASFGVNGELHWQYGYPVTANHPEAALTLRDAAIAALGESRVNWDNPPSMAAEDFSYMLQACPGAYFWLGADGVSPSASLHNAFYDFNDGIIADGIRVWVSLVERSLKTVYSLNTDCGSI
ncbi:M20 aminoacylase family protein [Prodigiosinella aquatilis]|nr:M20 aminoacylase family protein [Prodigiosinella sp. LS101]WJV55971.1 M20 aminoacylase family protein [Prodigiosinella sp. LS101]WJV60337.1 M20 aminoacylase family protein [Pectobacteriaceae bacterium C111]